MDQDVCFLVAMVVDVMLQVHVMQISDRIRAGSLGLLGFSVSPRGGGGERLYLILACVLSGEMALLGTS